MRGKSGCVTFTSSTMRLRYGKQYFSKSAGQNSEAHESKICTT